MLPIRGLWARGPPPAPRALLRSPHSLHSAPAEASPFPCLTEADALERLRSSAARLPESSSPLAFFSSVIGGVVTDGHLMAAPIDDHLVHRGHGVFDTATVWGGRAYMLEQHLARLAASARGAEIDFEGKGWPKSRLKAAILSTIRAAGRSNQLVRFWLGAGRGGFSISSSECLEPSFYCVAKPYEVLPQAAYDKGLAIVTSSVPMKPKMFANIKTTNYLPNALVTLQAERAGAWSGVWVTDAGNIAELPTLNIGFSFAPDALTFPKFTSTLAGLTASRTLHLAAAHLGMRIEQRDVSLQEAKGAREAFAVGGPLTTVPIVEWDGERVGDGGVGPVARRLREAQLKDLEDGWGEEGVLEEVGGLG